MKRLPKNEQELEQEARSLGLVGPNVNRSELPRSKIIKSIYDSKKIDRSIKFASILLVGSAGVGKSSTINHLLKNSGRRVQFTNINGNHWGTTSELTVSADYPQFEVKDLELHIVKLHATNDYDYPITKFYEEHPKFSGCKPNLIFILIHSMDGRFAGPNSTFVKSLERVKKLNIVDQHYPNVVAILTNCCSVPSHKIEKWKETLENKKKHVQDIISDVFKIIAAPVVLIENEYEDYDLQVDGNYTRLPDGTLQPENLYKACQQVLSKINDRLGLVILDGCLSKVDKSDQDEEIVVHAKEIIQRETITSWGKETEEMHKGQRYSRSEENPDQRCSRSEENPDQRYNRSEENPVQRYNRSEENEVQRYSPETTKGRYEACIQCCGACIGCCGACTERCGACIECREACIKCCGAYIGCCGACIECCGACIECCGACIKCRRPRIECREACNECCEAFNECCKACIGCCLGCCRCSKCCQSPATTDSSCFPSSALVRVKENDQVIYKKMNEISVGDKVFSWDYKRHEVVVREVIMFAHQDDNIVKVEYLKIILEDGESITMSGNHLVMIEGRDKATMAKNVHKGDVLSFIDKNGCMVPKKVVAIQEVVESGLFSPITAEGNIIVNNIVASCYCSISDQVFMKGLVKTSAHHVAHLFFLPMRVMHKLKVKWVGKLPENGSIHPYAKWLCKLNLPWTDKKLKLNN